jgi:hypothetical protein
MTIPFTQYLRPDGRQRPVWIERPAEIVALADQLRQAGYHFDIEELTTGAISMTVETTGDDEPLAHELCPNGPAVPDAVDRLIRTAVAALTPPVPETPHG